MKFYYITDLVLDDHSAPSIHVDEVCKNIYALGHQIVLFSPKVTGENSFWPNYPAVFLSVPKVMLTVFYQIKLFFYLIVEFKKIRPEVIYSRHSHLLILPVLAGRLFRIPVVIEVNAKLEDDATFNKGVLPALLSKLKIFYLAELINVRLASIIISVTAGIQEYLIARYRPDTDQIARMVVVGSAVNENIFRPMDKKEVRKNLGLEEDALYVGYIGSFHGWQGLRYIVESARTITQFHPNVRFLIVGGGDEREYLVDFIRDHKLEGKVLLLPPTKHELVPQYINALDICLSYPGRIRSGATSPFKIYEYLACGKAVVSSDIGGMREEFSDVVIFAEPESSEALSSVLTDLIEHPDARAALGQKGLEFIASGHTWNAITRRLVDICKRLID